MDFPTTGRTPYHYSHLGGAREIKVLWWNTLQYTLLVSAALIVIAFVLMPTSWENKLGILLLILFGVLLLGLKSEHVAMQAFATARFGLLFMLALWVIRAVIGFWRPTSSAPPPDETPKSPAPTTSQVAVVPPPGTFDEPKED